MKSSSEVVQKLRTGCRHTKQPGEAWRWMRPVKELNVYSLGAQFVQNDAAQTGISKNKPIQN